MKTRPADFNKGKYCNICYEDVSQCDYCNEKLDKMGWCSEEGKHYCNQDCPPELTEAIFNEEE